MKKISKIISMVILACFLFNTALSDFAFSQTINFRAKTDNLAPASIFGDLQDIEHKDIGRIKIVAMLELSRLLKELPPDTGNTFLDELRKRLVLEARENTVHDPADIKIFLNETQPFSNGLYYVKCRISGNKPFASPRTYYLVFSPYGINEATYPMEIYTERAFSLLGSPKDRPAAPGQYEKNPSILEAAEINIRRAAETMGLDPSLLDIVLKPKRVTTVKFEVPLDDGTRATFWGFRALQNDARGAGKGGLRWLVAKGETLEEAKDTAIGLATLMTVKNAVINIPYGGGKGDIFVEARNYTENDKARIIRAFSRELTEENAIGTFVDVPAPDKGTDARMMAWFMDGYLSLLTEKGLIHDKSIEAELRKVISSTDPQKTPYLDRYLKLLAEDRDGILQGYELGMVTGKPPLKGGSEGRTKATGFGGYLALKAMLKHFRSVKNLSEDIVGKALNNDVKAVLSKDLSQMTAAIQGTGNVGEYNAWELYNSGVKITIFQDAVREGSEIVQYTLYNPNGINVDLLNKNLERLPDGRWAPLSTLPQEFLANTGCDILRNDTTLFWKTHTDIKVPAATENVITPANAKDVNCEVILELANNPTTPAADKILKERGILVIPDVLANTGGVTVSYYEWLQNIEGKYSSEVTVDKMLEERMNIEVATVFVFSERYQVGLREAAFILYLARTVDAELARSAGLREKFTVAKPPYKYYSELGLFPDTVEELNNIIMNDRLLKLIRDSEKIKSHEIDGIVQGIVEKLPVKEIGFVLITGPTTSGKLGLAVNIEDRLKAKGRNAISLNFDTMTIEDLKRLKYGEEIEAVDYRYGKRVTRRIEPKREDIFVVQGNLALSDAVLGIIPQRNRFSVFANTAPSMKLEDNWPLTSLDLRLLRHILTINHTEGKEAIEVIRSWSAGRQEQLKRVYPSWAKADVTFNSYLPYELPVIKFHVKSLVDKALQVARHDKDAASIKIIERLERTLKGVLSADVAGAIPSDSIVQQYIDGVNLYERPSIAPKTPSQIDGTEPRPSMDDEATARESLRPLITDLALDSVREAGVQLAPPSHRYTLLVDRNVYRNSDELKGDIIGYDAGGTHIGAADRFYLKAVDTSNVGNMLGNITDPANTVIQVSGELSRNQIEELQAKAPGIRIIRVNTRDLVSDQELDYTGKRSARFNLYAMMLLARRVTKDDIDANNSIYRTLNFMVTTRVKSGEISAATDYVEALAKGDIDSLALIIKTNLSYLPASQWRTPKYNEVAATLISA